MTTKSQLPLHWVGLALLTLLGIPLGMRTVVAADADKAADADNTIRIATYNVSLYGKQTGEIRQRLADGQDRQAQDIAAVVQTVRPDILLINEIDHDADSATAKLLAEKFLGQATDDRQPLQFPYVYSVPSNTGVDSGLDLNRNHRTGEPTDCWGFGVYPGQYGMAVFSRFPIQRDQARTFQRFLWQDFPGTLRPVDPQTSQPYYDDRTWSKLRLSSKNHIDLPIAVSQQLTLHLLACHPTPPVFDGSEDRNGCRNHDEINFWNIYLSAAGPSLRDDRGRPGGLPDDAVFVVMGDLNADPIDGDGRRAAIERLLANDRLQDPLPKSQGAVEDATAAASKKQRGDPAVDTANFGRNGNLRVDFVLPSRHLTVKSAGVFWPLRDSPNRAPIAASDHRLVWVDVELPSGSP